MQKKIKWGFIEPLTGGMALGAEKAIGSAPDWVLSFPGFCSHTENQDGTVKSAMNEYHYLTYMKKHNKLLFKKLLMQFQFYLQKKQKII